MEDWEDDARISRDRCLEALITVEDLETGRSLWRAMGRYNERMRETRSGLEIAARLPVARGCSGTGEL
jgi:hypothetical protein